MAKDTLIQPILEQEVMDQIELQVKEVKKSADEILYDSMLEGVAKLYGSNSKEFGQMDYQATFTMFQSKNEFFEYFRKYASNRT